MPRHIRDLSTVQGLKIFFSDKGTKIPRKWRKIAKQGAPFGPLQKLGTLSVSFTRAFSEEELRNRLRPFGLLCELKN